MIKSVSHSVIFVIDEKKNVEDLGNVKIMDMRGNLVPLSLIHTCCLRTNQHDAFSTEEDLEKSIRRITRLVIQELKYPQHSSNNL